MTTLTPFLTRSPIPVVQRRYHPAVASRSASDGGYLRRGFVALDQRDDQNLAAGGGL